MICAKFDCQEPATHLLLVVAPGGQTFYAINRCEECGRGDVRSHLAVRGGLGPKSALVRIPARLRPTKVAA